MDYLDNYILYNIYTYIKNLEDKNNLVLSNRFLKTNLENKFILDKKYILKTNPNRDWLFLTFIKDYDYYGIKLISRTISNELLINTYKVSKNNNHKKLFTILSPIITYLSIISNKLDNKKKNNIIYHRNPQV